MIGRADETAAIERLLAGARSGHSGALVLRGEPGVGKSVLLDRAVELAGGLHVLRAAGVETEVDLPFAGLHQLIRPVLSLAERLPPPQRDALRGALGVIEHSSEDRFLIAAAVLSLLSDAAQVSPVLCAVEDAHWLDRPSAEALAFAARRLDAEGVVVLAATREEPWPGLPVLQVDGFGREDAGRLLPEAATGVVSLLVDETGGNPLALVELARSLSPAQLAGAEPLPRPLPLTGRVQEAFLDRVRLLPAASRTLLLVAAADDTADPAVVFGAAAALGIGPEALEPAERAGLASVGGGRSEAAGRAGLAPVGGGGRFVFRHPLVRAAVYRGATFGARTAVHRALAAVLDGDEHAGRRAWHLAAAATGPDDDVARDLDRAAAVALRRGGYAVASTAYERAAELSPARPDRTRRTVAAAEAAFQAGQADRAATLAESVDGPATTLLRGRIEFTRGSSVAAHDLLVAAARPLAERDPGAAAVALVEAGRAAWNANDPDRYAATAKLLSSLRLKDGDPVAPIVATSIAVGELMAGRTADALARLRAATGGWPPGWSEGIGDAALALAGFTRITGDDAVGLQFGTAAVAACRTRGLAARLPFALVNLSMTEALAGRHPAALVNATEGLRLARDLGQPMTVCSCQSVLAWLAAIRGDEAGCRELAADAVGLAETYRLVSIAVFATWALGLLELSLGRPDRALDRLLDPARGPLAVPTAVHLLGPDLVEAAAQAGRTDELGDWPARYDDWAVHTDQPWAAAIAARCRALLAGAAAETHYDDAVRLHGVGRPFERARTELLYGQWLRRQRRRAEARTRLTAAHETFERLGATPWADRAAGELRATGQTVRRRDSATVRLTPQEIQVVRLVAEGGSNHEVAAKLFISPRTVAYHLYKAYPKLGVSSRAELARLDLDALV